MGEGNGDTEHEPGPRSLRSWDHDHSIPICLSEVLSVGTVLWKTNIFCYYILYCNLPEQHRIENHGMHMPLVSVSGICEIKNMKEKFYGKVNKGQSSPHIWAVVAQHFSVRLLCARLQNLNAPRVKAQQPLSPQPPASQRVTRGPHSQDFLFLPQPASQGIARVISPGTAQRYTGHVPSPTPHPHSSGSHTSPS